jgi:hypothetical protein
MRKTIYISLSVLIAFVSCKKDAELEEKSYSYIKMLEAVDNNSSGLTLQAEILKEGSSKVLDYGFYYGHDYYETTKVSLIGEGPIEGGSFSKRFNMEFDPSRKYTAQAYIQHIGLKVMSNIIIVKSEGGTKPVIESVTPSKVRRGEIVLIKGAWFSRSGDNEVKINGEYTPVMNATDTTIQIRVPWVDSFGQATLYIESDGWRTTTSNLLTIVRPVINEISVNSGFPGDIITIKGENMSHENYPTEIYFDTRQATVVNKSDNELQVIIPAPSYVYLLEDQIIEEFTIEINNDNFVYKSDFTILHQWDQLSRTGLSDSYFSGTTVSDGFAYLIKYDYESYYLYNYDINNDDWNRVDEYPGIFDDGLKLATYDQNVFTFGGEWERSLRKYDLVNHSWDSLGQVPFEFTSASLLKMGSDLLFLTNREEVWKFSFLNYEFERLNDFPFDFYYFGNLFLWNGKIMAHTPDYLCEYQSNTDDWVIMADYSDQYYPFSHESHTFVIDDEIYLLDSYQRVYKYIPEINFWSQISGAPWSYNAKKTYFFYDNKMYVMTTGDGSGYLLKSYTYRFGR